MRLYAAPILKLLISGKREHEIFKFLWWVETKHMRLQGIKQTTKHIAKKLYGLLDTI